MSSGISDSLRIMFAIVITIAAVSDDMRRYKISNRIVCVGLVVALVINALDFVLGNRVGNYMFGGVGAFLIMLVAYAVMAVGAGDVKLSGVLGLLIGVNMVCRVLICAFLYTGIFGTVWMILGKCRHKKVAIGKVHTIHYSVALLLGEIFAIASMYMEVWI